eukprot:403350697
MNAVDNQKQSPRAFGLVHRKKGNEINISSFYLSDKYVDAFSKGINLSKQVHKLNLSRNQLTSNTVIKILQQIPKHLIELNLSNNPGMHQEAYRILAEEILSNDEYRLQRLILEGNKINDNIVKILSKSLIEDNSTLRFLNLSKNDINFNGAYYLGELLKDNSTLSVLFLHWNKLQAKGGQYIALALQVNNTLQILDLSFCALGNGRENFENIMKNALKSKNNNRSSINLAELSIRNINFGQGLRENHSILGLHMLGNEAKVDAQGFLEVQNTRDQPSSVNHVFTRIQRNYQNFLIKISNIATLQAGTIVNKDLIKLKATSNCWICEGWTEFKFTYKCSVTNPSEDIQVKINLSCDEFEGENMIYQQSQEGCQIFEVTRMLPPGEVTYYFQQDNQIQIDENSPFVETKDTKSKSQLLKLNVPKTNIIKNVIKKQIVLTETYLQDMTCIPRPPPKIEEERENLKTPWSFFNSVFKDYKQDTIELLNECFEFDWDSSKLEKIIKNEEERLQCKVYLKSQYKIIRETYKFYSGVDPVGYICSIGTNLYSDIISNCGDFIDGKIFKLSDLDLNFVATNSGTKKNNPRNPERQLVRYQFMEVLVRLAVDKFIKNGNMKSVHEAVVHAFENYFLPFFKQFDCHIFRKEKLWNEDCDIVFKRNMKIVQALYTKYSGKYAMPGQPKYMSLDEFIEMVNQSGIIDETFGAREVSPLYNISMMTQKNELDFDRHYNMILVEFLEALGRLADKLQLKDYFPELPSNLPHQRQKD